MASAPMRGSASPGAALFLQADMAGRRGDTAAALDLVQQVLAAAGTPPLMLTAAQSYRATLLHTLGRSAEAVAAAEAATELARRLHPASPDHLTALSRALRGEAVMLAQVGRLADALAASEESVRLTREQPLEDRAVLADALSTLASTLGFLDRRVEALPVLEELVALRRVLGDPERLAAALDLLAATLARAGDPDGAVRVGEEALALLRGATRPLSLARALNAQSGRVQRLDADRSLALADEAVGVLRGLNQQDADVRRTLASSLALRAVGLRQRGHVPELVECAREAVDLRLGLTQDLATNPQVLTGPLFFLADGLFKLSVLQGRNGDPGAALATNAEALEAFEELDRLAPGRHRDGVGLSLVNRGSLLLQLDRLDAAADVYEDAVASLRAASRDAAVDRQLAVALTHLTKARLRTERFADAVVSATEAAEILERLHDEDPGRLAASFVAAVDLLAEAFAKSGQPAEAEAMSAWAKELLATAGT
jgi:tetratricopeptide (TPR) repeat protein